MENYIEVFRRYKEGLIIGGLTGLVAAQYVISQGYDLNTIVEAGKGLLDTALSGRSATLDIARYKLYGTFMFVGASLGMLIDMFMEKTGLYGMLRFNK